MLWVPPVCVCGFLLIRYQLSTFPQKKREPNNGMPSSKPCGVKKGYTAVYSRGAVGGETNRKHEGGGDMRIVAPHTKRTRLGIRARRLGDAKAEGNTLQLGEGLYARQTCPPPDFPLRSRCFLCFRDRRPQGRQRTPFSNPLSTACAHATHCDQNTPSKIERESCNEKRKKKMPHRRRRTVSPSTRSVFRGVFPPVRKFAVFLCTPLCFVSIAHCVVV